MKYILILKILSSFIYANLEKAKFKPYIFFPYKNDAPITHNYGAFSYTNIHRTLPANMVGRYYQSGLLHTWYRPTKIYDKADYDRQLDGYHAMEGGVGYKPYLRFRSDRAPHKFTTGAVAGEFSSFSNGPGQGVPSFNRSENTETRGWEKNLGRYGAAQLSNRLLYPLDGISFAKDTNNQMLGYGYYTLPLTKPNESIAGSDAPAGNYCWTLFLNTKNFKGPVCFFTPYHWAKHSIGKPHLYGKCFDNSLLKVNSRYQRETNNIPAKKWLAPNGDAYYVVSPYAMASDSDGVSRLGAMPMTIDGTKWAQLEGWFNGGEPAPTSFGEIGQEIHVRSSSGPKLAFKIDNIRVSSSNFAQGIIDKDPSFSSFKWLGDLVKEFPSSNLTQMPSYYKLEAQTTSIMAIPKSQVPNESGLKNVKFPEDSKDDFNFDGFITKPIITPLHPNYTPKDDIIAKWNKPGPTRGPFTTKLSDDSVAVYYWYKFNEQPSILNSYMNDEERELIQRRVELIHASWTHDKEYFPSPKHDLAALDSGLIVTPPKGLEIGYVPICVHQQKADVKLSKFRKINRN